MRDSSILVAFDGACQGNPGPGGAGVAAFNCDGVCLATLSWPVGASTNNRAEWEGAVLALRLMGLWLAVKSGCSWSECVACWGDMVDESQFCHLSLCAQLDEQIA